MFYGFCARIICAGKTSSLNSSRCGHSRCTGDSRVLTIQREKSGRNGWMMQSDLASMHWLIVAVKRGAEHDRVWFAQTCIIHGLWRWRQRPGAHTGSLFGKEKPWTTSTQPIDRLIVAVWMKLHTTASSHRLRFELLTAGKENITVVTPCSFVGGGSTILSTKLHGVTPVKKHVIVGY